MGGFNGDIGKEVTFITVNLGPYCLNHIILL